MLLGPSGNLTIACQLSALYVMTTIAVRHLDNCGVVPPECVMCVLCVFVCGHSCHMTSDNVHMAYAHRLGCDGSCVWAYSVVSSIIGEVVVGAEGDGVLQGPW